MEKVRFGEERDFSREGVKTSEKWIIQARINGGKLT